MSELSLVDLFSARKDEEEQLPIKVPKQSGEPLDDSATSWCISLLGLDLDPSSGG